MLENLEYGLVRAVARCLGRMPRGLARGLAGGLAFAVYWCFGRLRRVGMRNLQLALPELSSKARKRILRRVYIHLGWQLVEFCRMTRYTAQNTRDWMRTEGLEHYFAAEARGKGVLIITGHLGAWELSSFYHSLMGHPMGMIIRNLDNRRLDAYVNGIRCLHGNFVISKDDFGRGLLTAIHAGGTVGILMDTNMTPPQGEFVPFFGIDACTGTGLAHIARKPARRCCRDSCSGSRPRAATCCASGPRSKCPAPPTARRIFWKARGARRRDRSRGFGAILTSGCGFTGAGRRAHRASRVCTGSDQWSVNSDQEVSEWRRRLAN